MRKEYLKIRDYVGLKELEKFGFVYMSAYLSDYYVFRVEKRKLVYQELAVIVTGRAVVICCCDTKVDNGDENCVWDEIQNKLFDLISAGLVEKVVEDDTSI